MKSVGLRVIKASLPGTESDETFSSDSSKSSRVLQNKTRSCERQNEVSETKPSIVFKYPPGQCITSSVAYTQGLL